jgi:hypothetical protein
MARRIFPKLRTKAIGWIITGRNPLAVRASEGFDLEFPAWVMKRASPALSGTAASSRERALRLHCALQAWGLGGKVLFPVAPALREMDENWSDSVNFARCLAGNGRFWRMQPAGCPRDLAVCGGELGFRVAGAAGGLPLRTACWRGAGSADVSHGTYQEQYLVVFRFSL